MTDDLRTLPSDLPVPADDGAAAHLGGRSMPDLPLASTRGGSVNLGETRGVAVLYCFPMMARSAAELPAAWSSTPGARGCTVQSLAFSDRTAALQAHGAKVYGVSSEGPARQADAVRRLGLSHTLLSDEEGRLAASLELPTFELEGGVYLRRVTLGVRDGTVERVWYPVFPPGSEVDAVLDWLGERAEETAPATSLARPPAAGSGAETVS